MLDLEFMRLAFGAGIVVGLLAPAVGFFLVQRRLSLVGDGVGHVAFAGVALGYLLNLPLVLTALVVSVVGGLSIEWIRARRRNAGDQALALIFYTGIAGGVVLVSAAGALNVNLFQFLFGSILTVTRSDLAVIAALGAGALVVITLLYRPLVAVVVDEEGARVAGLPVGALNSLTVVLAAVTIALSMRVVGILLIAALMVLPVIAASRIAWSMRSTILLGMGIGLGSVLAGITIAYYADLPPGGTTVLVAAATVLLAESWSAGAPLARPAHPLRRCPAPFRARRGAASPGLREPAPRGRRSPLRLRTRPARRESNGTRQACDGAPRREDRATSREPHGGGEGTRRPRIRRAARRPGASSRRCYTGRLPALPSRCPFPSGASR